MPETTNEVRQKQNVPFVFISHDARDADLAEAFSSLLKGVSAGLLKSFRSSDKKGKQGIEYGVEWYPEILKNIQNASDVVCLLTDNSVKKPWILFEAGMAKGKLDTPILGIALGIGLKEASTGPFAQFQNCDDDDESLTSLIMQLVSRIPNAEPTRELIKEQVEKFRIKINEIFLKNINNKEIKNEKELSSLESGNSSAKLFEEIKIMFKDIPSRLEKSANLEKTYAKLFDEIKDMFKNLPCRLIESEQKYKMDSQLVVTDKIDSVIRRYSDEIDLLKNLQHAGVTGIFKRRELAVNAFAKALNDEEKEIMIIGSSLKGLLQRDEYSSIANKLRFKANEGKTRVRFLLTHPIVADLRARQENRRHGEIAKEILSSLEILKKWEIPADNVRLYLGTPTCFAIKTTKQMLLNPYPYISTSFDSPCLHVQSTVDLDADRPRYFYDEFNSRHFGAWDSDLAVHIADYDSSISFYLKKIIEYSGLVQGLISEGKKMPVDHE